MLRLPSPFLSASSNVCFSHFRAELGSNTVQQGQPRPRPRHGLGGVEDPSPNAPPLLPFPRCVTSPRRLTLP